MEKVKSRFSNQIPNFFKNYKYLPDPKKHQQISFIKSGIRLLGYVFLPFNLYIAAGILLISEIIGIIEELV
tara:strand:+ start:208 stop:420 length:213 start_codon:yes stop_codon:yes gene_type:complete